MGRNLNYQFKSAIDRQFDGGGKEKASIKSQHTGKNMENVYSYSERKNLINTAHQLGDFIKTNYPDIKLALDVTGEMCQKFLNSKANVCDRNTLHQYASRIHKLEEVTNRVYSGHSEWYRDLVIPQSLKGNENVRNIEMTRTDYNLIINRANEMHSTSQAPLAIEFAAAFAMRVSETCNLRPKDIDYDRMIIRIVDSKGGKTSEKNITEENKSLLDRAMLGKLPDERIINIKESSVNKYLSRAEEALGIRDKYRDADTGIHALRKMAAQEYFDKQRENGLTQKEALDSTSIYLGHNGDRDSLMKVYVLNIH